MANSEQLKKISEARLKSAQILLRAGDWYGSVEMMGYALECALKSVTCKTLHLDEYPSGTRNKKIDNYFMTHNFDQLLIVSGMSNVFNLSSDLEIFKNWSEFTKNFPGDWVSARYDSERQDKWNKEKVGKLYKNLTDKLYGIIEVINNNKLW